MLRKVIATQDDTALLILRALLGIVFFPHGMQKVFGWFGGPGFSGAMEGFTVKMGIPTVFAFLAIMAESAGSVGLITGFLTRVAAFGITCNMVVAIAMVHYKNGFFIELGAMDGILYSNTKFFEDMFMSMIRIQHNHYFIIIFSKISDFIYYLLRNR